MNHSAIYTRISRDKAGRSEGVAAQERRGRRYASEHWPDDEIVVYCDNDRSAATDAAPRPEFERLRADILAGKVAHVWTVEQSRLTRSEIGWFELASELLSAGIDEVHTDRDGIVRLDEVAGIKAVLNGAEVRRLRQRVNDKLTALADEGRPPGGRSYGYRHVTDDEGRKALEIIPEEADAARWAADALLSGWSLTNIARELTARGAPTARGGKWTSTTVKTMLTSPTIAGFRVHRGEIVRAGTWEPILDETTWRSIRATLAAPRAVTRTNGGIYTVTGKRATARKYLLTGGVAVCGRCGTPLVAQQRRGRTEGSRPAYLCHPINGGCSGIGILADPLEDHATATLLAELDRPEFAQALAGADDDRRDEIVAALGEIEARQTELAARWGSGEITSAEWDTARAGLALRRADLDRDLSNLPAPHSAVDPELLREGWGAMTLDERRAIIGMFIEAVVVGPARPGTRRFDPDRVTIRWRAE